MADCVAYDTVGCLGQALSGCVFGIYALFAVMAAVDKAGYLFGVSHSPAYFPGYSVVHSIVRKPVYMAIFSC